MIFDLDLNVGDKVLFIGNEETDFFTKKKTYEVIGITNLSKKTYIVLLDDVGEENYITMPFYRKNFRKVKVTIRYSDDGTFTTETDEGILEWGIAIRELEELLNSIDIGYETIYVNR